MDYYNGGGTETEGFGGEPPKIKWMNIAVLAGVLLVLSAFVGFLLNKKEQPIQIVNVQPEPKEESTHEEVSEIGEIATDHTDSTHETLNDIDAARLATIAQIDLSLEELKTLRNENDCQRAQYIYSKQWGLEEAAKDPQLATDALLAQGQEEALDFANKFTATSRLGGDAISQKITRPYLNDQIARLTALKQFLESSQPIACTYFSPVESSREIHGIYQNHENYRIKLIEWREEGRKPSSPNPGVVSDGDGVSPVSDGDE